jgi:perosamine synthetase
MSNIQAALGLAQLEHIDGIVKKKRRIFNWYKKRLEGVDGISMNTDKNNAESNKWMSSIVLDKDFKISRDNVIKKLKERLVDSRPFFYPISMFPMYKEQDTPNAHHIGLHGINLPSGVMLTEEEVDYVAKQVREVLGVA